MGQYLCLVPQLAPKPITNSIIVPNIKQLQHQIAQTPAFPRDIERKRRSSTLIRAASATPTMALPLITPQTHPLRSLIVLFTAWKTLLLAIALGAASVSPGYDTSTDLFFAHLGSGDDGVVEPPLLARQLTRWDALYFVHAAASKQGGKVYEQEYAFGTGLSSIINLLARLLSLILHRDTAAPPPAYLHALAGVLIAHIAHLISALTLYRLTCLVFQPTNPRHWQKKRSVVRIFAFTTAALHILSPAGMFLSSPYAEAPFSCLSVVGSYLFARCYLTPDMFSYATARLIRRNRDMVLAGGVLGLATWFRSNGLASGLLFAVEMLRCLGLVFKKPGLWPLVGVASAVVGGSLVGAGSFVPQFLAWERYCGAPADAGLPTRPWCEDTLPSIYSFVQEHYWYVTHSLPALHHLLRLLY